MSAEIWKWMPRSNNEVMLSDLSTIFEKWETTKGELATKVRDQSEIFVREVVQNFMDAADDSALAGEANIPNLTFRFSTISGSAARDLRSKLGLQELPDRWRQYTAEKHNNQSKMPESQLLSGELDHIPILIVTEKNTSGMYGPWERTDRVRDSKGRDILNKMRDALLANARDTASNKGGRGSFGEGKKAIIGISNARSILVYTAFDPETTEDGTYSRLLGATYWPNHIISDRKFTGMGILGGTPPPGDDIPAPLRNKQADQFVEQLGLEGFEVRDPLGNGESGTTYLFLDPLITASECAEALVRNWWPAMDRGVAEFRVIENGNELNLDEELERHAEFKPFRDLLGHEDGDLEVPADGWSQAKTSAIRVRQPALSSCGNQVAGTLSLAIDLRPAVGFSQRDPDNNRSVVCLIRDHMVITYASHYRSDAQKDHPPFVRGVFEVQSASHGASASLLRDSEPAVHNQWQISHVSAPAAKHARAVRDLIREQINEFKSIYAKTLATAEVDLPLFREVLSVKAVSGRLPDPKPPKAKSPISMEDQGASIFDLADGSRVARAKRSLRLSPISIDDAISVKVTLGWEILGDRGKWLPWISPDRVKILSHSAGFDRDMASGALVGEVTHSPIFFEFESEAYSDLITIRPYMTVVNTGRESETIGGKDDL